jgi:glycine dehydrogenase subunit 2
MTRVRRNFHEARWDEPLLYELGSPGERGILPVEPDEDFGAAGDVLATIPEAVRRKAPPSLPEVSQPQVLRHYTRLSQMALGVDVAVDMVGTCTMKYSPKVNEALARLPQMAELHPLQDDSTIQGLLEIYHRFGRIMAEISGLDEFTFQAGSGAQGIFTNASIIRKYHESRGEGSVRDEIVTTVFSHPADGAAPSTLGYKVITLMPGPRGYPELDALRAAIGPRTAGLAITNPEDTGVFNPHIDAFVEAVHAAGGLAAYDQANANGLLGIARAREAGFDLCQFNLHKTFSTPHGGLGNGCAAVGVRRELARFLPSPVVARDGDRYYLDHDRPESVGKIRSFLGNVQVVLKSYAWAVSLGADFLRAAAETAVLNSNYLAARLRQLPGVAFPLDPKVRRLEQVRYSWEPLKRDTGVGTHDVKYRTGDYGFQQYWEAHVPLLVPEPFTIEPAETYSLDELDEYLATLEEIARAARTDPEAVRSAPRKTAARSIDYAQVNDPERWAMTWRAYRRKRSLAEGGQAG